MNPKPSAADPYPPNIPLPRCTFPMNDWDEPDRLCNKPARVTYRLTEPGKDSLFDRCARHDTKKVQTLAAELGYQREELK